MKKKNKISLKTKAAFMILVVSLLLSTAATVVSYNVYARDMNKRYKDTAQKLAETESVAVDREVLSILSDKALKVYKAACEEAGGELDLNTYNEEQLKEYYKKYNDIVQSKEYKQILHELNEIAEANDVMYMYICVYDLETGKGLYLIDGSVNGNVTPTGWVEDIESNNLEKFIDGEFEIPAYITNYDEYGWLCTATSSVYDNSGKNIANAYVDISMNEVMHERYAYLFRLCFIQILITAALVILFIYLVNYTLVRPINLLSTAARTYISDREKGISEDKISAISRMNISTGDELQDLCESIKQMECDINKYIFDLTHITAEKERIGAELNVATQIQASMLPSIFPAFPEKEEFDIFASMNPAKEVGGDFYDFFMVDENHIAVVMADVSGKGVPAALFMVIGKTLIKDHTQPGRDLGEVFTEVNEILCESNSEGLFITAFEGVLDLVTGEFKFVNAGHELPFICKKGEKFAPYKVRRAFVLAGMEGIKYKEESIMLEPGDKIFQYTDGVTEAMNATNELYGMKRLEKILQNISDKKPDEILPSLKKDIDEFVGDAPQFDDITMLCLEYKKHTQANK